LRNLLQLLGADSLDASNTPQPSLHQLDRLVNQVRASGLEVDFQLDRRLDGEEMYEPVSAGIELAAYRVVQEALTNVRKHAHATGARVVVTQDAYAVSIEVVDNGRPTATGTAASADRHPTVQEPGRGLIGMRERVAVYHGTFSAGPCAAGGWQVYATLPCGGP
jgi:signal transduction histidine kinase